MAMQLCPNGHMYDDSKNSGCPYCSNENSIGVTVPLSEDSLPGGGFAPTAALDNFPPTVAQGGDVFPSTMPVNDSFAPTKMMDDIVNEQGIVEVRGWLVCLEGEKRGVDYTIRGEKNTIGRGDSNDIKIDFDTAVSKGSNVIIAYDKRNNKFYISPGESKNNIYVNNGLLMIPMELHDYDVIELGNSKFLFRSLCNEMFTWEALKKSE